MTATTLPSRNARSARRSAWRWWRAATVAVVLALPATGCKSNKGGSGGLAQHDPLMSNQRIPPTSVPLPDRGGSYGKGNSPSDPLLGSPAARGRSRTDARKDDSERWKGPYIPSQASTPAALTANLLNTHSDLELDDRPAGGERLARDKGGERLLPASGSFPPPAESPGTHDQVPPVLQQDLAALGIRRGDYEIVKTPEGPFAIRARVTNRNGTTTRYEEMGPTAAAAAQRLLDQLKFDQRN